MTLVLSLGAACLAGCATIPNYTGHFAGRTEAVEIYDSKTNRHRGVRLTIDSASFAKQAPSRSVIGSRVLLVGSDFRPLFSESLTNCNISVSGQIRSHPPRLPHGAGSVLGFEPNFSPQSDSIHIVVVKDLMRIETASRGFGTYDVEGRINANTNLGEIVSSLYAIEGEIAKVTKTTLALQSISVRFIRPLPTAKGTLTPFKPGQIIVVHFNAPLAQLGGLQLRKGDVTRVILTQFDKASKNQMAWGSSVSWLSIKRHETFYDATGKEVEWSTENARAP